MGKVSSTAGKDNLVITPGGARPASQVFLVEEGSSLKIENGRIMQVDRAAKSVSKVLGNVAEVKPHQYVNRNVLRITRSGAALMAAAQQGRPVTDQWIVYSGWLNQTGKPITRFTTRWTVPPPPATDNGQLIYLFNGIENSSHSLILQPVLQWGSSPAGGGSYWAVANWLVGVPGSGIAAHSQLTQVAPGDELEGVIELVDMDASGGCTYRSSFTGIPGNSLLVPDIDQLTWANEALECYRLKDFSDYPDTLATEMRDIEIKTGTKQAPVKWTANNPVTDNGQHCSIISNASPGGSVKLYYRSETA